MFTSNRIIIIFSGVEYLFKSFITAPVNIVSFLILILLYRNTSRKVTCKRLRFTDILIHFSINQKHPADESLLRMYKISGKLDSYILISHERNLWND